ncbi:MAG: hypothetical protein R3Y58_01045 [Eubacteriales bacterium]
MRQNKLEGISEYLCPRIVNVETNHVYYGGDQSWLPRNTAFKGGCGPVCGANLLTTYADRYTQFQEHLGLHINEKHFINQDEYLKLLQEIYDTMHLREIPILNKIYDKVSRSNKLFKYIPTNLGTGICHFTQGILRFGIKKGMYLQFRSRSTMLCSYTRGLTFIKLALSNGYPVVLLSTNCKFPFMLYERPYFQNGTAKKMFRHFVTITDIRESTEGKGPELVITTWGKTGTIAYKDLYLSWRSLKSFGSSMVYFIPAKSHKSTKLAMLKAYSILIRH